MIMQGTDLEAAHECPQQQVEQQEQQQEQQQQQQQQQQHLPVLLGSRQGEAVKVADPKSEAPRKGGQPAAAVGGPAAPRLVALDAPRWIASAHVVGFHFYHHTIDYFRMGGMWTQFFFILSGFLLAYAEMARPPQKRVTLSMWQYVRKRLISIYPLYVFCLLMVICNLPDRPWFDFAVVLPLQLTLTQSILPVCYPRAEGGWVVAAWGYNPACWFLSCLLVYWLLLRPLSRFFARASLRSCCAWLVGLWLWSVVPGTIWTFAPEPKVFVDQMVRAGPLGFLHVFVAGVVTARVFVLTALRDAATGGRLTADFESLAFDAEGAPLVFRYGCCIGYMLWAAFAATFLSLSSADINNEDGPYVVFHNGGILPILILVLLGGALGTDPLAKHVFQTRIFKVLGQISYPQYLLQVPVQTFLSYYLLPNNPKAQARAIDGPTEPIFLVVFPFALLASAWAAERWIVRPYTAWQRA